MGLTLALDLGIVGRLLEPRALMLLGLLVLASSFFVSRTLNEWFERDLAARADLAVAGARDKITDDWSGTSSERMRALLTVVAHD